MNVSSNRSKGFYSTPEFINFLQELHDFKVEIKKFGKNQPEKISYNRLIENIEELESTILLRYKDFSVLEKILITTSNKQLTKKQKIILKLISQKEGEEVYTTLIDSLSEYLDIPKSTIRWNLKGLRESGLIYAGDRDNKGVPVSLTDLGRIMTDVVITNKD
ncbi:helix-turn-helix transcriptional regulator [Candidatus Bathyarchaeota archaeon]|nr:helix-turn-helix transcriptional regulator [Candidatus Bathyarchaeota archaeon]